MDISYIIRITIPILEGTLVTLSIFGITIVLSIPLGLLLALGRISKYKVLQGLTSGYILLLRGTPLMLQLLFVYFGLPVLGINLDRFPAAVIAFVLNYAAYFCEIFRAGIQSVNKGQYESAKVLNMSYWQTMRRIILPQVTKMVLPPVSNESITLVKDTALVYAIALGDLLRAAKVAVVRDFTLVPFVVAAVFYLIMTFGLTWIFNKLEDKYSVYN